MIYQELLGHCTNSVQPHKKGSPIHLGFTPRNILLNLDPSLCHCPCPHTSRPFWWITDASDFLTGAILEQPDALNWWHPVAYHSKSLQLAEWNYEIHNKLFLAIVCTLEIFHHYLKGWEDTLEVWSDHRNLVYFFIKQKLTHCQAHWALFLSCFKFIIIHKSGTQNKLDALSRRPEHKEGMALEEEWVLLDTFFFAIQAACLAAVTMLGDSSLCQQIKSSQEYNREVSQALEIILKNGPHSLTKGLEEWNLEDGIILYHGQVYVPRNDTLQHEIVKHYHDHITIGHPGQ